MFYSNQYIILWPCHSDLHGHVVQPEYFRRIFIALQSAYYLCYVCPSACPSVRLSACIRSVPTGWTPAKRDIGYMYINQQDAQNSCDQTLFSIRCSTCFGLYQSIFRSSFYKLYIAFGICRYMPQCGCCVAIATQQSHVWYRHIPVYAMYSL